MLTVEDPQVEPAESELYRWTVRVLYAVAIGINIWILLDQVNEANPTRLPIAKAKAAAWLRRAVEPLQAPSRFRRHANQVIYEATEIVESA